MLDAAEDPAAAFETVHGEIAAFDPVLAERLALVALNKIDLVDDAEVQKIARKLRKLTGLEVFPISADKSEKSRAAGRRDRAHASYDGSAGRMSQLNYKESTVARARRIVIKVGSAVLSDVDGLRVEVIEQLAAQIESAVRAGQEIVIVTSGAVAAGRARLSKLHRRDDRGAASRRGHRADRVDVGVGARIRAARSERRADSADASGFGGTQAPSERESNHH